MEKKVYIPPEMVSNLTKAQQKTIDQYALGLPEHYCLALSRYFESIVNEDSTVLPELIGQALLSLLPKLEGDLSFEEGINIIKQLEKSFGNIDIGPMVVLRSRRIKYILDQLIYF